MFNYLPTNKDFRGIIQIWQDGDLAYEHIHGYRDLPNAIPIDQSTKFASASAGKIFVAVAILQLVEQQKINLQQTLGELLPELTQGAIDPSITVEQLLTHTSGIPDYFDETTMEDYEALWLDFPNYKIRHNHDLIPLFINKPMMYSPGERFQYNNTGFVVLAMIIEKISEIPFDQYLKINVFDPCGMTNTGYYALDQLPANTANHYILQESDQSYKTNIYSVDVKGTGAGGAFISVVDIASFWHYLLTHTLLSKEMTRLMMQPHTEAEDIYYGYGVWIRKDMDHYLPSFQGYDPGVSFFSEYHPTHDTVSILVSNYGDNVWAEMRTIRTELYEKTFR